MKNDSKNQHKQVPAKVTAYVDEGIKDLVELLNTIPNVCTIDSCEGSDRFTACVSLDYGIDYTNSDKPNIHALVEFADTLWGIIKDSEIQGKAPTGISEVTSLSIEWHPRYNPTILIEVRHKYIGDLVNILRPLCNEHMLNKWQSKYEN